MQQYLEQLRRLYTAGGGVELNGGRGSQAACSGTARGATVIYCMWLGATGGVAMGTCCTAGWCTGMCTLRVYTFTHVAGSIHPFQHPCIHASCERWWPRQCTFCDSKACCAGRMHGACTHTLPHGPFAHVCVAWSAAWQYTHATVCMQAEQVHRQATACPDAACVHAWHASRFAQTSTARTHTINQRTAVRHASPAAS